MLPLVFDGRPQRAAEVAAGLVAGAIRLRVEAGGRCAVAFSGGASPNGMFDVLASVGLPWSATHVFQVDERVAPDGHPDRNATALRERLLARARIPPGNVHLMPVTDGDLGAAAARYGALLDEVAGGVLDVVHLGLGDDGHTASWPPGDPVATIPDDGGPAVAMVGPFNGRLRMTLTPPAVNRARARVWLVDGPAKAGVVARLLRGDEALPAAKVKRENSFFVADGLAAPSFLLSPGG